MGAAEEKAGRDVQSLLAKYCQGCHGENKPKAGLNLVALRGQEKPQAWKGVWERVRSRHMPPPGKPQPTAAERALLLDWIEAGFAQHKLDGQPDSGPLRPRRLNVREYRNTLRDLVITGGKPQQWRANFADKKDGSVSLYQVYPPPEHPFAYTSRILPQDTSDGGFDTVGDNLSIPPFLMEKYFRATKVLLDDLFSQKGSQWNLRNLVEKAERGPHRKGVTPREALQGFLREFASRAFREPVTTAEVDRYLKLFDQAQARGENFDSSIRLSLQAILISPRFVVLWSDAKSAESKDVVQPLSDHELAARLSYFLWSSVPDQELLKAAEQGKLREAQVLEQHTRRMLKDIRVTDGLLEGFLCQWLQLDRLDRAAPDAERYPFYFRNNLAELMACELRFFTDAILVEDRSILEFIDADWGFTCYHLAKHYGIENFKWKQPPGSAAPPWYRVKFADKRRGGVLTMGKVLTGTSQPTRTSPVHRGKWVLETILGTPPPPPPPDVDNVLKEEKAEGKKSLTVRQLLERHRANPACFSCHQTIDPLGMPFESFDPVGRWRDRDGEQLIDAGGALADGTKVKDVEELKTLLLSRKDEFVRCFVEQMLTYALGRKLEFYDAPTVKQISRAVSEDGYKLSRVVVGVVRSYPFRHLRVKDIAERGQP